jgi:histidinol-phosphatase (PHP family)
MEATCERALRIGLPAIAFTDHADFVQAFAEQRPVDIHGYLDAVEHCRARFPGLRILSGVELGEPHRFPAEVEAVLGVAPLDRVLGSVHVVRRGGADVDMSQGILTAESSPQLLREYFGEVQRLVESALPFEVLAHLDYPKRYWPHAVLEYREADFEEELRAVLSAAARRGSALEVNTTRGADPRRGLCPGPVVLAWWREEGGERVSFGSDSHEPAKIAAGFGAAAAMVEAAGFRPATDPAGFWRR